MVAAHPQSNVSERGGWSQKSSIESLLRPSTAVARVYFWVYGCKMRVMDIVRMLLNKADPWSWEWGRQK